jgi:DNA modification methylase
MLKKADSLLFMKSQPAQSINLIYTDVPYNMGSKYFIDKEGHYCFKKSGSDFMNKWEAMDGRWWFSFMKEAYRITKSGGFFITHNIDRQSDLWTYYGRRAGFMPIQKLYWLFIDSYPKGVDLGLGIDNALNVERETIGLKKGAQAESTGKYGAWGKASTEGAVDQKMVHHNYLKGKMSVYEKTIATSPLAKKYDGFKYGQAPLKQIMEEIVILWKEPEDMTVPRMVISTEESWKNNRPSSLHPSIFNIRDTRVKPSKFIKSVDEKGRWTPQLLVSNKVLPEMLNRLSHEDAHDLCDPLTIIEQDENWLFCRKPNTAEREAGLAHLPDKTVDDGRENPIDNPYQRGKTKRKNIHPTPKPIALCKWVLRLFSPPDTQDFIVYDPFTGQGSIPVAAEELGLKWLGTEINEEFIELAEAKLAHYKKIRDNTLTLF